ncbi:MAG TPA: hypothetical protein VEA69_09275, partial [Tepidisphaeraceae bacterium]|nr:hypothetical protein [Tepidisphaeraceae bacterium]
VHIADISRAFCSVLKTPEDRVYNEAFNIGQTSENHRVRDVAEIVARIVPGVNIEYAPGGSPDLRCYRVNCDKAANTLVDFRPQWTVEKGAVELYETYKKVNVRVEDFEGPKYQRIAHIKKLLAENLLDNSLREVPVAQRMAEHAIH